MIYARIFIVLFVILVAMYYAVSIMQMLGLIKYTTRKIKFPWLFIPFFYYFASEKKNTKTNKNQKE